MKQSFTKRFFTTIIPFAIVAAYAAAIILSFFNIDDLYWEPALTIIAFVLAIPICVFIIMRRDMEAEGGWIHLLTLLLLIAYAIIYICNLENLTPENLAGYLSYVFGIAVAPGLTFVYLFFYAYFKMDTINYSKPRSMYLTFFILLVGFAIGLSFGVACGPVDCDTGYGEENIHRCAGCGEVTYITETYKGFWFCDDCKNK